MNVGGAVIPTLLALYLLVVHRLFVEGAIAVTGVAGISYALARPVPGVGIAVPIFIPPVAAAVAALLLAPDAAPALAYAGGSLGTLIGADLANLGRIRELRCAAGVDRRRRHLRRHLPDRHPRRPPRLRSTETR